jgi:hypothetical protein
MHSPAFVLRHAAAMLKHTFAGTSIRSAFGLETAKSVFNRYRAARRRERSAVAQGLN